MCVCVCVFVNFQPGRWKKDLCWISHDSTWNEVETAHTQQAAASRLVNELEGYWTWYLQDIGNEQGSLWSRLKTNGAGKLGTSCSPQACPLRTVSAFIAAGAPWVHTKLRFHNLQNYPWLLSLSHVFLVLLLLATALDKYCGCGVRTDIRLTKWTR